MLALVATLSLGTVAFPGASQAYEQNPFCNTVVAPLYECKSAGLHSWYRNWTTTGYSGAAVCAYEWDAHNGVVRGGVTSCDYMHVEQLWNRTGDAWYNARAVNANTQFSIVFVGQAWA